MKIDDLSEKQRKRLEGLPPDLKEKMAKILADDDEDDDDDDGKTIHTAFHIDLSDRRHVDWARKKGVLTDEDIADLFPEESHTDDDEGSRKKKKRMIDRWAGDDDDTGKNDDDEGKKE